MKPVRVSEDIVPLSEFKAHATDWLERVAETGRAVVITQNGRPAAVLVSPADFDRLLEHQRFVGSVTQGLADVGAGRVVDDDALGARLDDTFGPLEK